MVQRRDELGSLGVLWSVVASLTLPWVRVVLPIGVIGALSWAVWTFRVVLSHRSCPTVNDHRESTSVVVPSYREDPDVLLRCLDSWLAAGPDEVIIVIDVGDIAGIERLAAVEARDERLRVIPFKHHGKRSALGVGIRAARFDVIALADSDTAWAPDLLRHVVMPFVDPAVGGVGTRQRVHARESSVWRRIADWLVNIRYLDYVPAMGAAGSVACLSGRTAAYRRDVILPLVPHLEHEIFFGRECNAGDDGRLTWLTLAAGYKTVHQDSARAVSMFPNTFRAFVRQRVRWSRNSYRCYLTSIFEGWLWHQPFVTQVSVLQNLLTPLTMATALWACARAALTGHWLVFAVAAAWVVGSRGLRSAFHLWEHPEDLPLLPLLALVVILIALPIKVYAFFTMNHHGWLTRDSEHVGGEGQTEASLTGDRVVVGPDHA